MYLFLPTLTLQSGVGAGAAATAPLLHDAVTMVTGAMKLHSAVVSGTPEGWGIEVVRPNHRGQPQMVVKSKGNPGPKMALI